MSGKVRLPSSIPELFAPMTESHYDAVVLGGGMAGLGAAERLHDAGKRVVVVEAAPTVGGLARSITVGGEPIEP